MVPEASRVAILWDPAIRRSCRLARVAGEARTVGVTLLSFEARSAADLDGAFASNRRSTRQRCHHIFR